jgi:hypothetical protein
MGTKFGPKKGEDTATNTILRKLAILVPTYYVFFYIVTCIITAAFGVPIDGKEPFDFVNFNPADGGRSSGKFTGRFLLAMVPFVCCVPLFLLFQKKLIVPLFKCFFFNSRLDLLLSHVVCQCCCRVLYWKEYQSSL